MAQEMNVLRCYSCQMFQVHIVKKAKKWQCKICNEKQSMQKVYYQGSGQDCRLQVQHLNLTQHIESQDWSESFARTDGDETTNVSKSITETSTITNSKWTKYMVACKEECHHSQSIGIGPSPPNCGKNDDNLIINKNTDHAECMDDQERKKRSSPVRNNIEHVATAEVSIYENGGSTRFRKISSHSSNVFENNESKNVLFTKDVNFPNGTASTSAPHNHRTNNGKTEPTEDDVHSLSSSSCCGSDSSEGNKNSISIPKHVEKKFCGENNISECESNMLGGVMNERPKLRDKCSSMKRSLRDIVRCNRFNTVKRAGDMMKKSLIVENGESVLEEIGNKNDINRYTDISKPSVKRKSIFEDDYDESDEIFDSL